MINISSGAATCVPENYWVSSNPSFVALESTNQKQFWDRETNPTTSTLSNTSNSYGIPYINPTTSIFGCNNTLYSSSSSSPTLGQNITPFSQVSNYSPTNFLKKEGYSYSVDGDNYVAGGGIGLNLGHRTYFSSRDKEVTDRIFRRPRGSYQTNQVPRCQAEGCKIDLSKAKHYHKRHKVCEFHSKATRVVAAGLEQRFCQQCSRFHVLAEFDEAKRSCRKRLADHNRRRRKPQPGSSESRSAKAAGNAFPQVRSIASRSELKETSLSSSTLPLMISNNKTSNNKDDVSASTSCVKETVTNGPALSLGGEEHQISYSATHQQPFIFNKNSLTTLFQRESLRSVSPYHNLLVSTSNEAPPQSTRGWLDMTQQHPEDLQNLLHLGQAMFEVEFL